MMVVLPYKFALQMSYVTFSLAAGCFLVACFFLLAMTFCNSDLLLGVESNLVKHFSVLSTALAALAEHSYTGVMIVARITCTGTLRDEVDSNLLDA